jgi:hypothetical protein
VKLLPSRRRSSDVRRTENVGCHRRKALHAAVAAVAARASASAAALRQATQLPAWPYLEQQHPTMMNPATSSARSTSSLSAHSNSERCVRTPSAPVAAEATTSVRSPRSSESMRTPPRRRHCPVVVLARPGSSFTCIVLPGPTWKTPSRTRSLSEGEARRPPRRGPRPNAQLRVQTLNSDSE